MLLIDVTGLVAILECLLPQYIQAFNLVFVIDHQELSTSSDQTGDGGRLV